MALQGLYPIRGQHQGASQADRELIRGNPLLRDLSDDALEYLFTNSELRLYRRGEVIFPQGETSDCVFISLKGQVTVVATREDGERTIVEVLPAGSMFLLSSALLRLPYVGSVEAPTDMRVLAVPLDAFHKGIELHHTLATTTLRQTASHVRLLANQVKQLKLQNANERLANYVLARCKKQDGSAILELEEERKVIAQRLGMTPESLSRSIAALKEAGVFFDQRTVRIDDVQRLQKYCGLEIFD